MVVCSFAAATTYHQYGSPRLRPYLFYVHSKSESFSNAVPASPPPPGVSYSSCDPVPDVLQRILEVRFLAAMSYFPHRLAYINNVDCSLFVRHVLVCFVSLVVEGKSGTSSSYVTRGVTR
jgi:hypothetical protein